VAGLDTGPVQDFSMMSRQELMRAIEAVDGPPSTALCRAVLAGNEEQASWCLCRGGIPEMPCSERLVQAYPAPQFALHYAAYCGNDKLVSMLFENRGDLHCMDGDGNQPLAWAAGRGMVSTVEELVRLGADVRHKNNKGKTALNMAVQASSVSQTDASRRSDFRGVVAFLEGLDPDLPIHGIPGLVLALQAGQGVAPVDGPETVPEVHQHPIQRTLRVAEWRCDGCTAPGRGARYRSTGQDCDFDLCQVSRAVKGSVCARVFACVRAYVYVCMYACMYFMYACMYICIYIYIHTHTHFSCTAPLHLFFLLGFLLQTFMHLRVCHVDNMRLSGSSRVYENLLLTLHRPRSVASTRIKKPGRDYSRKLQVQEIEAEVSA
jgi:hypothetical protein